MRTRVDDALRRLRANDPGQADVATDRGWSGSTSETLAMQRIYEQEIFAPDRTPQRFGSRWARRWPAAIASVAVVAGISFAIAELSSQPAARQPGPAVAQSSSPGTDADPHEAQASAFADRLLASAPVLPHAVRRARAPEPVLHQPMESAASSNLIDRAAWWTAPGTVDQAIASYKSHEPAGLTFSGSSSASDHGVTTSQGLTFDAATTSYAAEPELLVEFVRHGSGVAVRVDVQLIWIPSRPAWTTIADPSAVTVTVQRGTSRPAVSPTLRGALVSRLSGLVNRLQAATPGTYHCPADFPGRDQSLRFTVPTGTVHVTVMTSGCAGVTVSVAAHRPFALEVSGALERMVREAVGLPPAGH